jgi:hypothetical protein
MSLRKRIAFSDAAKKLFLSNSMESQSNRNYQRRTRTTFWTREIQARIQVPCST